MPKTRVISFINMKGGVGKTTLAINTADYLANKKNKKVLVLDLDPQFNATQSLLLRSKGKKELSDGEEETLSSDQKNLQDTTEESKLIKAEAASARYYEQLSTDEKTILQIFTPTNSINNSQKDLIVNFSENLSFIPGDLELSSVIAGDTAGKVSIIDSYITDNHLKDNYDYILIDCPPTWSILTHSALYASNYYIIPSKIDFYSSIGINSLQDKVTKKLTGDRMYQETSRSLQNLGIVFSMTTGLKAEEDIKKIVIKDYKEKIPIFDDVIPLIKSASSGFVFYSEVEHNGLYSNLINGFDKIMTQMLERVDNL